MGLKIHLKSEEVKDKIKKTNIEKYGTKYTFQSEEVKVKRKETMMERYSVNSPMKSTFLRNKIENTNIERYGVKHPLQSSIIQKKILVNSFRRKPYLCWNILGYEDKTLDYLINTEKILIENIKAGDDEIPVIPYKMNDKNRVYFPDIYIPSQNRIIEVKSVYTMTKEIEELYYKSLYSCQDYIFELFTYDKKNLVFYIKLFKDEIISLDKRIEDEKINWFIKQFKFK